MVNRPRSSIVSLFTTLADCCLRGTLRKLFSSETAVLTRKIGLVIPVELRVEDAIGPGDSFEIRKARSGEYLIRRVQESPNEGLSDWLLSCPVKGYFQPISSKNTDAL